LQLDALLSKAKGIPAMPERDPPFEPNLQTKKVLRSSFSQRVEARQEELYKNVMAPQNLLRYSHGIVWKHPANDSAEDGSMEQHTAEVAIPFERIVDGDLSLIDEVVSDISRQMDASFMRSMYDVVNASCEKSGNIVSAKEIGFPEAFAGMLEKIEFSVNKDGEVELPQLHTADASAIAKSLEEQPPEYHERIEAIKERKIRQALEREAERKSKFRTKE
jgi:hypothetical protein